MEALEWLAGAVRAWQWVVVAGLVAVVVCGLLLWLAYVWWDEKRREGEPPPAEPLSADDVDAARWTTKQLSAAPLYPPKDTD